jgi:hypothetical protein
MQLSMLNLCTSGIGGLLGSLLNSIVIYLHFVSPNMRKQPGAIIIGELLSQLVIEISYAYTFCVYMLYGTVTYTLA